MKRQGRQHGAVRTYWILQLQSSSSHRGLTPARIISDSDLPPTFGLYTRVTTKPDNHSKFTGKCGQPRCFGCHSHPVSKSVHKSKGSHKLRSHDVALNHRLVSWRVVDNGGYSSGPAGSNNLRGSSASRILDQLASPRNGDDDDYYDYESESDYQEEEEEDGHMIMECDAWSCQCAQCFQRLIRESESHGIGVEIDEMEGEIDGIVGVIGDGDEDEDLGFVDVELDWDPVDGDEGWALVGGLL
ncbi:hypothetical protein Dimus_013979 [Dionaea muscipula]